MNAQVTKIAKGPPGSLLSKRIALRDDGTIWSDAAQCWMTEGLAARMPAPTATSMAHIIEGCKPNQAIALGALAAKLPDVVRVAVAKRLPEFPGAIARTRDYVDYRLGEPAWGLIDFDQKGMPPEIASRLEAPGAMWKALVSVAPDLARASRVSRQSTSAGLYRTDTNEQLPGSGGEHHYLLVQDGSDIKRLLDNLHDRCWLSGYGWHLIGAAGQLLERSIVDTAVGYGERLCFEGEPDIVPPLAQRRADRLPIAKEGEALDSRAAVPPLTAQERQLVQRAKQVSAASLGKEAKAVRVKADDKLVEKIVARTGVPRATVQRQVALRHIGILTTSLMIDFDEIEGLTSVGEVLADPELYIGETLADPLEGASYGRCKAKVMRGDDGLLFIHSFAHGRAIYKLRYDFNSTKAAIESAPLEGFVDFAMSIFPMAQLEFDEMEELKKLISAKAGVGMRVLGARIAKEKSERERAQRESAAESNSDERVVRACPPRDGELLGLVSWVDSFLSEIVGPKPPMRDASGYLVEVRNREPWSMHLLTSEGANADSADETRVLKAPSIPSLCRLSEGGVQMETERYVNWTAGGKDPYSATLPAPFAKALMRYAGSVIPVVMGINSAPLISMSGEVITGVGYDRLRRIYHQIDPDMVACVPSSPPTETDAALAMLFLLNEWLVDVKTDDRGKCIVIMLALSLIERPLLPERPAWFITAHMRGSGKTTLANMISQAVVGRSAPAAAWSDGDEERRKAVFAHMREGEPMIIWDNMKRGSKISCPHIEKALTAEEIIDRVLGGSVVEVAPATTIQIFTGNAIAPRGDMASRSLTLTLSANRPDPENGQFAHEDAIGWTKTHRSQLLTAFYTLLMAGAAARLPGSAKTRFKIWWQMCGWPVEYAAGLLGLDFDCAELVREGEDDDEDATAVATALAALSSIWGTETFTSKDVLNAMQGADSPEDESEGEARAASLRGALDELADKARRNEEFNALRIGKLLGNTLVGRPSVIKGVAGIATLRSEPGHDGNLYRVEITFSDTEVDAASGTEGRSAIRTAA